MKKLTVVLVCVGTAVVIGGGGYGIYRYVKASGDPVEVTKVAYLNSGWWGNESTATYGMITSNATQEVNLDGEELVNKIYVKEGDKVKIGDKLLSFDTTLLELDLESEKLNKQTLELELQGMENDLAKLKTITPVADNMAGAGSLVKNEVALVASQIGETESETVQTESQETETQATETQETETQAQTEAETQPPDTETWPEEEETESSPLEKIKALKKITYKSKPYKGSGTKEEPYVFFCIDGAVVESSFMNKMIGYNEAGTSKKGGGMRGDGKGSYAVLEIREGDSVSGGFLKSVSINGTSKSDKPYAPGITWTFTSQGIVRDELEVDEPEEKNEDDWNYDDDGMFEDDSEIYTVSELKAMIAEKEDEIKNAKLDIREAELKVKQAKRKLNEATVTATINGVVKTVGDPETGQVDEEPFLTVNSDEGLYVRGTISELKLDSVEIGAMVDGMSQESSIGFTATITEVSEYPDSGENYYGWSDGNTNVSNYPFLAYIEDSSGLNVNEYVSLNIQQDAEAAAGVIYLEKPYIRSENGQSYVWITDENKRLKKQYIKTGKTLYGSTVEVKEGLSDEDYIAFPYGKNVKEGARTVSEDDEEESSGESTDDIEESPEEMPEGTMEAVG